MFEQFCVINFRHIVSKRAPVQCSHVYTTCGMSLHSRFLRTHSCTYITNLRLTLPVLLLKISVVIIY